MKTNCMNRGLTWVEVLVLLVIAFFAIGLLLPLIGASREAGRRASCLNRVHLIGLELQSYESSNRVFPPSAIVASSDPSRPGSVGGWSFLVRLLPFMEHYALYKTLPTNGDPEDTANPAIAVAVDTQLSDFVCPSSPYRSTLPHSAGITNYKAMGASTRGSLVMAANPQATPPYGTMSPIPGTVPLHPDGAIFPGNGIRTADIVDGLSHTIFTIETIDEVASRWAVGKEATLVGLPQKSSPTDPAPDVAYNYFMPPGYGPGSQGLNVEPCPRTFLSYDFSPTGADAGKYEDPGFGQTPAAYGPSSMHPAVVICGMGDASVHAISKQIGGPNLFFLITKNGKDPFYIP